MSAPNDGPPRFPVGTLLLAGLLALLMLATWLLVRPPAPPDELQAVLRPEFRPLAPFQLSSLKYGPIGRDQLHGKWTFVYFGYLSCPDRCRNTLHELADFRRLLDDTDAADAARVQVLFVSVDPERDNDEALAGYVARFDSRFIGATAGRAAVERLARRFGADVSYQAEGASGQYAISHSGSLFLVDPHARIVASFSEPLFASTLLAQFRGIADYYAARG